MFLPVGEVIVDVDRILMFKTRGAFIHLPFKHTLDTSKISIQLRTPADEDQCSQ